MKCKDFEFEFTVAANELSLEASEHGKMCQRCQGFMVKHQLFEEKLAKALHCEAPKDLRHSLREKQVVSTRLTKLMANNWPSLSVSVALAASIIMSVILVTSFVPANQQNIAVGQLVFEHIQHDVGALNAAYSFKSDDLALVEKEFGLLVKQPEALQFASRCEMGDTYGLHLVLKSANGQPITVIYMPEVSLAKAQEFNYSGLKGWVKPVGSASLAIVAGKSVDLPEAEAKVSESLVWL